MANIAFMPQTSGVSASAPAAGPAAGETKVPAQQLASLSGDSVKLSVAAQVKMMHHQGLSPNTISAQVGIPVSQVNSYLPGSGPAAPSVTAGPQSASSEPKAAPTAATASAPPIVALPSSAPATKANE